MKTSLMLIATLSLGTAAVAQSSAMQPGGAAPAPMTAPTSDMPSAPIPDTSATPAPASTDSSTAAMPTDSSTNASTSAPAMPMASGGTASQTAMSDYPACSRSVTDKCVQKGSSRKSRR